MKLKEKLLRHAKRTWDRQNKALILHKDFILFEMGVRDFDEHREDFWVGILNGTGSLSIMRRRQALTLIGYNRRVPRSF